VPPSAGLDGVTESIIGDGLRKRPEVHARIVLATQAAGPVRGYEWLRNGSADVSADHIVVSCESSLRRLHTEDIDACDTTLPPELLAAIDRIRWELRDPAQ
jgi:aryl-alcohol dehydrogenase-like predicted oxidoreductase